MELATITVFTQFYKMLLIFYSFLEMFSTSHLERETFIQPILNMLGIEDLTMTMKKIITSRDLHSRGGY